MSESTPPPTGDNAKPDDTHQQAVPRVVVRRETPQRRQPESPYADLEGDVDDASEWPVGETIDSPPRSRVPPFMTGLLLGIVLSAVSVGSFLLLRDDPNDSEPAPVVAPTTETTTLPTSTVTTIRLETTTVPTVAEAAPPIDAIGDPIAIEELQLAANGIGLLAVGDSGSEVVGRLVATFGQPDADSTTTIADGAFGSCPGDPVRHVQWGPLEVTISTPEDAPVFSGYRLDLALGSLDSPVAGLTTVSGLKVGDSIETLESIYAGFNIEYVVEGETGLVFELRNADGTLLLWGPVTSAEPDGVVSGIFSPGPCPP